MCSKAVTMIFWGEKLSFYIWVQMLWDINSQLYIKCQIKKYPIFKDLVFQLKKWKCGFQTPWVLFPAGAESPIMIFRLLLIPFLMRRQVSWLLGRGLHCFWCVLERGCVLFTPWETFQGSADEAGRGRQRIKHSEGNCLAGDVDTAEFSARGFCSPAWGFTPSQWAVSMAQKN